MEFILYQSTINARRNRTHCKYGHEYTPENTARSYGYRVCVKCRAAHNRVMVAKRRARKRAAEVELTEAEKTILSIVESRKTYGRQIEREVELLMLKGRVR